jgi:ubiquitin-protein ligase
VTSDPIHESTPEPVREIITQGIGRREGDARKQGKERKETMSRLVKRLTKEIATMAKENQGIGIKIRVPGIDMSMDEGNAEGGSGSGSGGGAAAAVAVSDLLNRPWRAYMKGPKDTPFEDCVFAIDITIPTDYPHKPPTMMFINQCWHPNIGVNGHVCVDILQREWSPTLSVLKILQSVQSMLDDPDPTSPLNGEAAVMYRTSKESARGRELYRAKIQQAALLKYSLTERERTFDPSACLLV